VTGGLGGRVARRLADRGVAQRLVARDPGRVPELPGALTYHAENLHEAYASRAGYGAPHWEVTGWVTTYTAIAAGELDLVSDAVATVAARPPMDLVEFLRRNPDTYRHLVKG
jgi:NAD(P)H dehydrogenase (quinone)